MRTLKHAGIAVVAILALALAPGAAAGSAGGVAADNYPATLHGETNALYPFELTLEGIGSFECNFGEEFDGSIEGPSPEFSLSTSGGACWTGAPIHMNDCEFEFEPESGTVDIGPPTCSYIEVYGVLCHMRIVPQTLSAEYTSIGSGSSAAGLVEILDGAVTYYNTKTEGGCLKVGTHENLSIDADIKVSGTSEEESVGVTTVESGGIPVGLFMFGSPFDEEYEQLPEFDAQAFPSTVTAQRQEGGNLTVLAGTNWQIDCETMSGVELAASARYVAFDELGECTSSVGAEVEVRPNSCHYRIDAPESEFGSGWADITCDEEGDQFEFEIKNICTFKVPPQWWYETTELSLENNGSGFGATVDIDSLSTGVTYKKSQPGYFCPSFGGSGSVDLDVSLSGVYAG